MRIKIAKKIEPIVKVEYINNIDINFRYNNLDSELNKKYKEIVSNIRVLNEKNEVNVRINSSNNLSSNNIEIDYSIELKPYQYPTKELNEFYSNFSNFLFEYKKSYELSKTEKDSSQKQNDALSNLVSRLDAIEEKNSKQSKLKKSR